MSRLEKMIPARISIGAVFFLANGAFGNWLARIPEVRDRLAMDDAQLGLCLLGMSLGSVCTMYATGGIIARLGGRWGTWLGYIQFVAALLGPAFAPTGPALFLTMVPVGAGWALLHVGMNTVAHETEGVEGRPILATCHGLFSLGGMAGAIVGSFFAREGTSVTTHLVLVLGSLLVAGAIAGYGLHAGPSAPRQVAGRCALPSRPLLGLCTVAFLILLVEGAVADWGALLLRDEFSARGGVAGLGFAIFSLAMAVGRLRGDWLSRYLSAAAFLRFGAGLACVAFALGLSVGHSGVMLVALGLVGLGLANVIPVTFRLAAGRGDRPAAVNVAAVSAFGQSAFLVGPPLLGLLAEATSLSCTFWTLAAATGLVVAIAGRTVRAVSTSEDLVQPVALS